MSGKETRFSYTYRLIGSPSVYSSIFYLQPCVAVCLVRGYGLLGKLGCLALRQARWGNDENTLGFARVIEEGTFPGKDSR